MPMPVVVYVGAIAFVLPKSPPLAARAAGGGPAARTRGKRAHPVGSPGPVQNLAFLPARWEDDRTLTNRPAPAWIAQTIATETKALEKARRHFVEQPDPEALHKLRTGARRLRSLLEDTAALHRQARLLRRVKRTAKQTDVARDAAVQRELLLRVLDESEREAANPLLRLLVERERDATKTARRKLSRARFKTKGERA
jgi:hypothetical protein